MAGREIHKSTLKYIYRNSTSSRTGTSMSDRAATGVRGLDEMLSGGIPRGRIVVLIGSVGTGKTILSTQFLVEGLGSGEGGVFISLDEGKRDYYSEMLKFGWDLAQYERKKLFAFIDASPVRTIPGQVKVGKLTIGRADFSLISLLDYD